MAEEIVIGRATEADTDILLEFWTRAGENEDRPPDDRQLVVQLIRRDPDALIVARAGTELVGTVIVGWDGWRCHLYRLAVDPARRGVGIARRLVQAAEARGRSLGARRMDAMVLDDNALAHRAWSRLGYRRQQNWSRWVKPLEQS